MAQAQDLRLVFMGTPDFAATVLERLAAWPKGRIVAVYTQPDRPRGRGMRLEPSPVKIRAQDLGLELRQPENFKNPVECQLLASLKPDILVVAAYGLLLPKVVLDAARIAPLNVHASLLPRYRGAAPIQRCIMENWRPNAMTGVSIMHMEPGLDTGPVYAEQEVPIARRTSGELTEVLAREGAELLLVSLDGIIDGTLSATAQDASLASYAAKVSKEDGRIDCRKSVAQVDAQVRALTPAPGARIQVQCKDKEQILDLRILKGHIAADVASLPEPGTTVRLSDGLGLACADGIYVLDLVRPNGRKDMTGPDFANGYAPIQAVMP